MKAKLVLAAISAFFLFGGIAAGIVLNLEKGKTTQVSIKVTSEEFRGLPDQEQLAQLKEMAQQNGIEFAREFLKSTYPEQPADEHELIHVIGEVAFLKFGYAGLDFCDSFFNFGCYHGVVLETIRQKGYDGSVLRDLAQGCLNLPRNRTTITACNHGVGHALMVVKSYDLILAYQDCDKTFVNQEDLFFCYDGVSMENVMRRFEQEGAVDNLSSDDPLYPCNIVPEKYQAACAREHIFHARRAFYAMDTQKTAQYCLYFPEELARFECFSALGTVLNQDFFNQPETVIQECNKVGQYSAACITRAAAQYAFAKQFEYADMLCKSIALGTEQERCLGSVEYAKAAL